MLKTVISGATNGLTVLIMNMCWSAATMRDLAEMTDTGHTGVTVTIILLWIWMQGVQ